MRRSELTKRILEEQTSGNKQQKEKEKYAAELEDISAQIIELNEKQNTYEEQIKSIQAEMNQLSEQFRISQTSYHREQSRLESLKNITERYDGYGNSIRRVMDNKNQEPGLLGVVADLIKVEKQYEIAIETALGGSIQNIVTRDEDTAKRMIQFLKKNKFGRATFLPLTSIRPGNGIGRPEALKEPGVIGPRMHLLQSIRNTTVLHRIFWDVLLLLTTLIMEFRLRENTNSQSRIVTLEGELSIQVVL